MYETILVEKKDKMAWIKMNRPDASNAFSLITYGEIKEAMESLGGDGAVRAVIITGEGRHFSAGGDIRRFKKNIETERFILKENVVAAGAMSDSVLRCPKPVIAMINGAAAGAGCSLALACDFRVMSEKSKLVMAFINMGLSGDTGAVYLLGRLLGTARTAELMALGTPVRAEQAYQLGLCNRLAKEGELEEVTRILAQTLTEKPTQAIARQKQLNYEFFYRDFLWFNQWEADFMRECSMTEDHREAVDAFLEKRTPVFKGR